MWIETECRSTNININVSPTPEGNVKHLLFYCNIFHVKSMNRFKIVTSVNFALVLSLSVTLVMSLSWLLPCKEGMCN